jgi:hypothetical protein
MADDAKLGDGRANLRPWLTRISGYAIILPQL